MRVAVNLAISHRRGLLARFRHPLPTVASEDPTAVAISKIEGEKMRSALLSLSPRERAVLALRYGRDLSFAEIGSIVGEPDGTVRTLAHRAVQKLRRRLADWIVDQAVDPQEDPGLAVKF